MVNLAQFFPPVVDVWVMDCNDRSTWKYLNLGLRLLGFCSSSSWREYLHLCIFK